MGTVFKKTGDCPQISRSTTGTAKDKFKHMMLILNGTCTQALIILIKPKDRFRLAGLRILTHHAQNIRLLSPFPDCTQGRMLRLLLEDLSLSIYTSGP